MKTHYKNGCPWADGKIYADGGFDTNQTTDWSMVTCQHCLKNKPETRVLTPQERSKGRTSGYWNMSFEDQWAEDKRLGILDWDGN